MNDSHGPVAILAYPVSRSTAERWSLVLASQGIDHRLVAVDGGWTLGVQPDQAERATQALGAYLDENPPPEPEPEPEPVDPVASRTANALGPVFGAAILAFHGWAVVGGRHDALIAAGASRSSAIVAGAWHRAVTALTLHADLGHVLANAVSGGLFLLWLARAIGAGPALGLTLTSGVLGNVLNAWLRGPGHGGIGASTAVFGAVGVLAGRRAMRLTLGQDDGSRRPWWLPLAAAVAVLALMGSSERSDVLAHLTGLVAGGLVGIPAGWLDGPPSRGVQAAWVVAAASVVGWAWWRALGG